MDSKKNGNLVNSPSQKGKEYKNDVKRNEFTQSLQFIKHKKANVFLAYRKLKRKNTRS